MMQQPGPWVEMQPGIRRQTIAIGPAMMQLQVRLDAGSTLPIHQHPHEQLTYVVHGRLRFTLADATFELETGAALMIPGGVPHGVETLEDTLVIDTFSPPREDLLDEDQRQG